MALTLTQARGQALKVAMTTEAMVSKVVEWGMPVPCSRLEVVCQTCFLDIINIDEEGSVVESPGVPDGRR